MAIATTSSFCLVKLCSRRRPTRQQPYSLQLTRDTMAMHARRAATATAMRQRGFIGDVWKRVCGRAVPSGGCLLAFEHAPPACLLTQCSRLRNCCASAPATCVLRCALPRRVALRCVAWRAASGFGTSTLTSSMPLLTQRVPEHTSLPSSNDTLILRLWLCFCFLSNTPIVGGLFAARQVAPWILLDPKHTYSYLMKTRYQNPSGPHGGNVDSGARNKGYRFPAPG